MTVIHFHCPSADVFYRKRRFIATVRYSAHSELYIWLTFETGVFVSNENGTFLLIDRVLRYLTIFSLSDEDKFFRFAMSVCPK